MRKVPELRFDGFEGEWEEKKIRNLGSVITGTTPKTSDASNYNGKYLFASPSDMYGQRYITNTDKTLSEHGFKKSRLLPKGSSLFVSIGATVGKMAQAPIDMATNQQINSVVSNNKYDQDFVFTLLNYNSDKIIKIVSTQTMPIINKTEFSNTILVTSTNLLEQEKIGNLFKKIDALIEIQEGKVAKMEEFKKSMLQKMFPKKDELVPEFRFDGLDGEWGSIKLSYISNRVTRRNLENQSKLPLTISSEFGLVNQLDYYNNRVASKDISNYYLIINGEFAYNKSTSLGAPYGAIKRLDNYENGALSTLYIVFEIVENNLDYMKYYFETSLWHKEIYKVSQEGARNHGLLNIATNDFFSMRIKLPSLEEQEKIGQFFKTLDTQIENEEKLLDSYKMMKKSLLQKMIV